MWESMLTKQDYKAMIRTARIEDAKALLDIQREVIYEKDYFIAVPEEFFKSEEEHQEWIKKRKRKDVCCRSEWRSGGLDRFQVTREKKDAPHRIHRHHASERLSK